MRLFKPCLDSKTEILLGSVLIVLPKVKGRVAPRVLSGVKVQIGTKNFIEVEIRTIRSVKSTILSSTEAWPIQGHCDAVTNTFSCIFFLLFYCFYSFQSSPLHRWGQLIPTISSNESLRIILIYNTTRVGFLSIYTSDKGDLQMQRNVAYLKQRTIGEKST